MTFELQIDGYSEQLIPPPAAYTLRCGNIYMQTAEIDDSRYKIETNVTLIKC